MHHVEQLRSLWLNYLSVSPEKHYTATNLWTAAGLVLAVVADLLLASKTSEVEVHKEGAFLLSIQASLLLRSSEFRT